MGRKAWMPFRGTRAYVDGGVTWLNNDPLDADQPSLQSSWVSATVGYYATRWLSLEGFSGRTRRTRSASADSCSATRLASAPSRSSR